MAVSALDDPTTARWLRTRFALCVAAGGMSVALVYGSSQLEGGGATVLRAVAAVTAGVAVLCAHSWWRYRRVLASVPWRQGVVIWASVRTLFGIRQVTLSIRLDGGPPVAFRLDDRTPPPVISALCTAADVQVATGPQGTLIATTDRQQIAGARPLGPGDTPPPG